jgi:hypothetical protein
MPTSTSNTLRIYLQLAGIGSGLRLSDFVALPADPNPGRPARNFYWLATTKPAYFPHKICKAAMLFKCNLQQSQQ